MKEKKKVIRVTCKGASWLKPGQFETFQGDLKELREEDYQKIRAAIIEGGFSFRFLFGEIGGRITSSMGING